MNIIIAPDSFKGSLSAREVAQSIENGIHRISSDIQTIKLPIADGGEGTVETVIGADGGTIYKKTVNGPLFEPVEAAFGITPDGTAVIETAAASGITLIKRERLDPVKTSTFGTGELILEALKKGAKKILIGLGGTATNDGGTGAAAALGVKFLNKNGEMIENLCGQTLADIESIDLSGVTPLLKDVQITLACDVQNPLLGQDGCSFVFAPQKGASSADCEQLEKGMTHYRDVLKRQFGTDVNFPCAGAAGGFGVPFILFWQAEYRSGIETMIEITGFESYVKNADLIITGEGKIDGQSVFGKVPVGVAAKSEGRPVIVIAGAMGEGAEKVFDYGISSIITIENAPMSHDYAMQNAAPLIESAAERVVRIFLAGRG